MSYPGDTADSPPLACAPSDQRRPASGTSSGYGKVMDAALAGRPDRLPLQSATPVKDRQDTAGHWARQALRA